MSLLPFAGGKVLPHQRSEFFIRWKLCFRHARFDYEFFDCAVVAHVSLEKKPHNGGVDAVARIQSSIAGPVMMRNTLPPLASNDLLAAPISRRDVDLRFIV